MKRHILAVAVAVAVAVALAGVTAPTLANSNLSAYGILDIGILVSRGGMSNAPKVSGGNLFPSLIGVRGTEDLSKGYSVNFVLEAELTIDTGEGVPTNSNNQLSGASPPGGLAFNGQSWLGIKGPFGEVRLGRDFTPTYWTAVKYDVAYTGGTAGSETALRACWYSIPGAARSSNAVVYITPAYGGVQLTSMYALGENASTAGPVRDDGRYAGARLSWAAGRLDTSLAYARHTIFAVGDLEEQIIGAAYDLALLRLSGFYTRNDTQSGTNMHGYTLGVSIPAGANIVNASFSTSHTENQAGATSGDVKKISLQGIHKLSKRTALYAIAAHVRNANGAKATTFVAPGIADHPASSLSLGIQHSF